MKKLAKVLLVSSVILLGVSLTGPGGEFMWGALKPLSALLFGGAFISYLLADEYATYDAEQERKIDLARRQTKRTTAKDEPVHETDLAH
jgi:hypothetical protein